MDDNKDNGEKTLKISSSKLKLNIPVDSSKIQQTLQSKSTKVTVLKKKRIVSRDGARPTFSNNENSNETNFADDKVSGLTSKERLARLEALKKVEETAAIFQSKSLINNQAKIEEVEEKEEARIEEQEELAPQTDNSIEQAALPEMILLEPEIQKSKIVKKDKVEKELEIEDEEVPAKVKEVKAIKSKFEPNRRNSGKININLIPDDEEEEREKVRSLSSLKRAREKAKKAKFQMPKDEKIIRDVVVPEIITVQELANRMSERTADVIKEFMKLGTIVTANQEIDADTAEIVIESFGHNIKRVSESDVEKDLVFIEDAEDLLTARAPVVTIMGHVDHGKTSLLDALRSTDVVAGEAGGITQHIGAYRIELQDGKHITFIDTPGHEAFTAMRARGAEATDIVVIVVAADDGIMEQTKEAINHAKAAEVPVIVAVNKIDKPEADPQRVRTELLNFGLVPEEFGGDIIVVDVSAKAKLNLDKLEEAILLQAEMLNLRSNKDAEASGVVIESRLDKNRGVLTTFLVQRGTLQVGDIVVAGKCFGKVKKMSNDKGKILKEATPSMPVEILGFSFSPDAGDKFNVVKNEKQAREIAEYRERMAKRHKVSLIKKGSLEDLFAQSGSKKKVKTLPIIIKGDVQGSIEAIIGSLSKFENAEIKLRILHTGVGGITKSDVILANASGAIIIGFNVRADTQAVIESENNYVDIRYYSIIYNLVDDIKAVLSGMLSPIIREEFIGKVRVQQVFNITKVGKIAGCLVIDGIIKRDSKVRILRDNIVKYEGNIKTLKRYKDEVKEVKNGQDCGIAIENYDDLKENDVIEVFEVIEEKQKL